MDQRGLEFVIKATTPEEMQVEIVKWLRNQSTIYTSQARLSERKTIKNIKLAASAAYADAANFIERLKIENDKL